MCAARRALRCRRRPLALWPVLYPKGVATWPCSCRSALQPRRDHYGTIVLIDLQDGQLLITPHLPHRHSADGP